MEKRLIIAVALSFIVLMGFQKLFPTQAHRTAMVPVTTEKTPNHSDTTPLPKDTLAQAPDNLWGKGVMQEKETEIETREYKAVFTNKGGNLKDLTLLEPFADKKAEKIFSGADAEGPGIFGIAVSNLPGLETAEYEGTYGKTYVEYKTRVKDMLDVTKRYTVAGDGEYLTAAISFKNLSPEKIRFSYEMVGPCALGEKGTIGGRSFIEADTMIDGSVWRVKAVKGKQERSGKIEWTALKGNYFTFILKPFQDVLTAEVKPLPGNLKTVLTSEVKELAPQEEITDEYVFYAGPLDEKKIQALGLGLEKVINYGFFGAVSKVLLSILALFHTVFRNWGVAIIFLTLTVNIVLFPLTYKSFTSMQQMKQLQPHLQKLRVMHKDNPQKLNKETMELYRKYNVNPLGGCLPMLLQMPIFIALYQGLVKATSLKGAHFLWIKDLSAPDAVIKLPSAVPLIGTDVNILPLLMVGAMFLQQKFSQAGGAGAMSDEQAQQQKMMMVMMPVMFGIFFYKMPAGLVLYWLTNTVLMTLEQSFIAKRTR